MTPTESRRAKLQISNGKNWISVADELPPNWLMVLVCAQYRIGPSEQFCAVGAHANSASRSTWHVDGLGTATVTHWQHLPILPPNVRF